MGGLSKRLAASGAWGCAAAIASIIVIAMTASASLPEHGALPAVLRVLIAVVAAASCLGAGTRLAMGLRRHAPAAGRRVRLSAAQVVRGLALRSLLVVACALGLAAVCGAAAVIAQHTVLPAFGLGTAAAAVRAFALAAALAASPLPVMLLMGFVRSRRGAWRPWRETASMAAAYLPLLAATAVAGLAGWGIRALCALVPVEPVACAAFALAAAALGTLWLAFAAALCLFPEDVRTTGAQVTERLHLPRSVAAATCRRARQATACAMALLLAAGLVSPDAIAFAVEGDGPAVIAPAPDPVDPAEVEAAAPPEPVAKAPEGYYDTELPEGKLVYAEDDMAVYQTSARNFITVIGGTAATYVDDQGTARAIDNTLEGRRTHLFSDEVDYTNRAGAFTATLPDAIGDARPIRLEKDGHSIELTPQGGDFSRSSAEGEAIRYTEVKEGIDYQYTLVGNSVKEDIVLTRAVAPQQIATRIKLSEGLAVALEDGVVVVRDTRYAADEAQGAGRGIFGNVGAEDEAQGSGPAPAADDGEGAAEGDPGPAPDPDANVVFAIAAPSIIDAAGAVTDELALSLVDNGDGTFALGVEPDWDWICAPERAYPVRIDPTVNIAPSAVRVGCVEQTSPNSIIGENGYSYAGFDDGIKTGVGAFKPGGHYICRAYAAIDYNFGYIMSEAKINSATFSLCQYRAYSGGATNFGLYRVTGWWDFNALTWNSQTGLGHEFVQYQRARTSPGYINWDVREVVNNWVQGVYTQRGFCVKAENERWMQCEMFENRYMANPPRLTINWEIPDPVNEAYPLNDTTINLRTVTEHDANNKLAFDGVFADGMARPRAWLAYELDGKEDETGLAYASRSYKYPDSSSWDEHVPNGTKYKDKLSNWQTHLFTALDYDKEYKVKATPTLDGATGTTAESDRFLIYKASAKDTLPYIASHYGTTLDTLSADNRVQDTLVVGGNTLFVRNPTTTEAYAPKDLTTDQKKRIDSALMGRGKHCEYGFEPINLNTGNFVMDLTDATLPDVEGDFALARTYNAKNDGMDSPFGRNWSFAYAESLGAAEDGTLVYSAGDGKTLLFEPDGQGGYTSPVGFDLELVRIPYKASEEEGGEDAEGDGGADGGDAEGEGTEGAAGESEGEGATGGTEEAEGDGDSEDAEGDDEDAEEEEPTLYRYELRSSDGSYRAFDCWGMLTEVHSAKGLVTKVAYDEAGRLASITAPTGAAYALTLDDQGHITQVALPDGNTLAYSYDAHGNLASYTDATGATVTYAYDERSRMTEWRDANGTRIIKNLYDDEDRVTCQWDAAGNASTLAYAEGSTTTADAAGNVTIYRYDDQYRTTSATYPDGHEVTRAYDADNNLVSDEDGAYAYDEHGNMTSATVDGHTTSYAYDAKSRLVQMAEPDGTVTTFNYDEAGNLAWTASNAGDTVVFTYDELGRCLSATDADGVTASFSWEGGCVTAITDGLGNTTHLAYDAMGRCVSVTDALGNTSRTIYDAAGRVVAEQDATGACTAYALDAVGLLEAVTDPRGYVTSFTYDEAYNIASMTDALGNATSFEYDALGNLTAEVGPTGAREERAYDSRSRLASVTDAEGGTASFAYDGRGRMVSAVNPLGGTEAYTYEGTRENPATYADALGNVTAFTYDARGNAVRAAYADGATETARYGLGGRLESATDAVGLVTAYAYTAAGRLSSVDAGGRTYQLSYDAAGNTVAATDPLGRTTSFAYDAAQRLTAVTDEAGNVTELAYDEAGRQVGRTDALGNATTYAYDGLGNMVSETDPLGNVTAYAYDELGRLVALTDALGATTTVAYDEAGDAVAVTDALGATRTAAYDKAHRIVEAVDATGAITGYSYDAAGNLAGRTLPTQAMESFSYDAAGNLVRAEDARGYVTTLSYDGRGRVAEAAANNGSRERYAYDNAGNITSVTDALGNATRYSYNRWGELTGEASAAGGTAAYAYDDAGQLVRTTDAAGAAAFYGYDMAGNLVSRSAGGSTERIAYDAAGNVASYTDGNGHRTTYAYDAASRLTATKDALGQTTSIGYDAVGNAISVTDARGHETLLSYDAAGNLTGQTDRLGQTASYAYDAEGRLAQVTAPTGAATTYARDALGNVTEAVDALGRKTAYAYDELGALTSITSPSGASELFERDVAGRMTAATDAAGSTTRYAYDAAGALASKSYDADPSQDVRYARDGSGAVLARDDAAGAAAFERDGLGRITRETDGFGRALSYAYDDRGNLESVGYPDGSEVRYGYDRADNLVSVAAPEGEYRYSYDAADRPVSLSRPNGTSTTYAYDAAGNVSRLETMGPSGALISCYAYGYDAEGRIAAEDATVFGGSEHRIARSFSYDGEGRLVAVEASGTEGAWAERYSYDEAGNRTSLERTGDEPDTVAYAYDADDRLVRAESASHGVTEYGYDAAGQLVSKRADGDGETTYEHSVEGRLAAVKAGGRTLMAATYDGDGNRIMQASPYHEDVPGTEGSALDGGAGDEGDADEGLSLWSIGLFWYGFAAGGAAALAAANPAAMAASVEAACALVEATWPEGAFDPAAADYALSHLGLPAFDLAAMTGSYGVGEPGRTDELLDVVTYTNSSVVGDVAQVAFSHSTRSGESDEVYGLERLSKGGTSYAYDGRGSVAQTLGASGTVSSWHVWGAFGEQEAGSALGELPSYGFNGEEAHPQTGLQYLRARYYDTESGRFGVQDSYLGQLADPLSLNRYLYCLSDPLNLIDPSGHWGASVGSLFGNVFKNVINQVINVTMQVAEEVQTAAALARGDYSAAQYHAMLAARYRALVVDFNCGNASYATNSSGPSTSDWIHTGLDVLGMLPGIGAAFDVANGVLYLVEGNYGEAALSFVSAIPGYGDAIGGANAARKGLSFANTALASARKGSSASEYVNIASASRTNHILKNHRFGGKDGKSWFPQDWSDERIMHEVSDIITDPAIPWYPNKNEGRLEAFAERDGVTIKIVTDGSDIITAYPVKRSPHDEGGS